MLRRQDTPLFSALVAIAIAFVLNAAVAAIPNGPPHRNQPDTFWQRTTDDPINLFTGFLALFTVVLAGASIWQGYLTNRSINLARDEFNATHRPKIVVRSITLLPGSVTEDNKEGPAIIDFLAANNGDSPARIISFIVIGYIQGEQSAFVPLLHQRGERRKPPRLDITPGRGILIRAHGPNIDFEYEGFKMGDGNMFVIGEVEYGGPDQIIRTMGFCRLYNRDDGMWYPHSNPTYEYN